MKKNTTPKKIAIVYDWIDKWGGVERLLLVLREIFPEAQFYTTYVDRKTAPWASHIPITESFISKLPGFIKKNRLLSLVFYPLAFESFDFSGYDVVISVTSSFAKSVITKPNTFHICILLTPTRFLWVYPEIYINSLFRKVLKHIITHLLRWDFIVSKRPDKLVSISKEVAERSNVYYKRSSDVVYPPFDLMYWNAIKKKSSDISLPHNVHSFIKDQNYYLVVSRLEKYKKIDTVVQVFNNMPEKKLIIVGKGTQEKHIRNQIRKSNILIVSDITDMELGYLYQHAEALIMPQREDFGYTSLEAQFFGCPVLSYRKGGVTETVIEQKTGLFFDAQTAYSIGTTLERFEKISYNLRHTTSLLGKKQVMTFSKSSFIKQIGALLQIPLCYKNNI